MTPKLAAFLKEDRQERKALWRELGKELNLDDLVFANAEGKPLNPSVLSYNFGKIARKAGLQGVRFHDLWHTFASLILLRGAKPKVISEALGHASVAFTMDTYSHIMQGIQSDAMALLNEVLPAGKNGTAEKIYANFTPISDIMANNN
jgi:integrase